MPIVEYDRWRNQGRASRKQDIDRGTLVLYLIMWKFGLDAIPGIGRRLAEELLSEVGVDMDRFRSASHLAPWAMVCPSNN